MEEKHQNVPLEIVDLNLMRFLLSVHAKTPIESLYLESGAKSVSLVISSQRLCYLNEIHIKEYHKFLKHFFKAQKRIR